MTKQTKKHVSEFLTEKAELALVQAASSAQSITKTVLASVRIVIKKMHGIEAKRTDKGTVGVNSYTFEGTGLTAEQGKLAVQHVRDILQAHGVLGDTSRNLLSRSKGYLDIPKEQSKARTPANKGKGKGKTSPTKKGKATPEADIVQGNVKADEAQYAKAAETLLIHMAKHYVKSHDVFEKLLLDSLHAGGFKSAQVNVEPNTGRRVNKAA